MTLRFKPGHRIFVYSEYVDLRAGFDKLSMIVREKFAARLVDGDLYVFLGRDRRKCKAICYDGTGVLLIAKRMERGRLMRLEDLEEKEITVEELDWLLRGSVIRRAKFGELPVDNRASLPNFSSSHNDDYARTGNESRSRSAVRDPLSE
jgi:transposase